MQCVARTACQQHGGQDSNWILTEKQKQLDMVMQYAYAVPCLIGLAPRLQHFNGGASGCVIEQPHGEWHVSTATCASPRQCMAQVCDGIQLHSCLQLAHEVRSTLMQLTSLAASPIRRGHTSCLIGGVVLRHAWCPPYADRHQDEIYSLSYSLLTWSLTTCDCMIVMDLNVALHRTEAAEARPAQPPPGSS
jgi:hypothetical protein